MLPEHTFFSPLEGYEPHDWRDPFVFWNAERGEYWMLLAARKKDGPSRRRGCTALCASRDLVHWEIREPFWAPGMYFTHECPDLFRMGDWWYLVYSTFTERCVTHYRMSRSLHGPWLAPENDTFDGRAFGAPWRARFAAGFGRWKAGGGAVTVGQVGSWSCASAGPLPDRYRISATVSFTPRFRDCGLMLRTSADFESGYYVRLEPDRRRIVADSWPRPGDRSHWVETERPLDLQPDRPHHIRAFVARLGGLRE